MVDEKLDEMERKFKDFDRELSNGRKKGGDTRDATKIIKKIPTKIKLYEASKEQKDIDVVNELFKELEEELKNVWTSAADSVVNKIEYYLEIGEMDNVDFYYKQLKEIYPKVEKDEKKRVYNKILQLREKY